MSGIGGGGAMQATALAKQNEFLKGYIVRLQRQLEDYLGSYLPPPSSTSEREAEQLPPWIGDTTSLSPLLEAYDRRIAEADAAYESLSSQQAAIQARTRQLTAENERLMAEVKQLTSMAMARAEEGDLVIGSESSNAKVLELEEKLTLLTSENEVLVDECKVVREEMRKAEAQATTSAQQLKELREQNTVLRRRVAAQEVEDSQGAASMKSALAEAERKSSQSDRLRMELDAAEREVKVLAHELQSARHDLRVQAQTSLEARKRAEEQAERHQAERSRLERELAAVKETQQSASSSVMQLKHTAEDMRARADEYKREAETLRRHQEETERQMRTLEQQLIESRARAETFKDQMRRLEEEKDELQLATDQAIALKEQAQREIQIQRLSERLQHVLVEAQQRSEETVLSIRNKYQAQKAKLQQQLAELEVELATLQSDKERLMRDKLSAESEVEKLAQEGPGGNVARLQREIDTLAQNCKDLSSQRDQALHGGKASELAVRRKEAQWEQAQLQSAAQIEQLQRRLRAAEADAGEAKEASYNLRTQTEAYARQVQSLETELKTREAQAQERMQRVSDTSKAELAAMLERVRRAEEVEASSKRELSDLLAAHDKLQDKWREASRDMAMQSQRHITDLREEGGRLESRNRELNDKLSHALAASAGVTAKAQQQERAMERLRLLLEASEKRAEEAKAQLSALMRNEAELLAQRSRDTLQLQRREHEVTHLTAALQQSKQVLEALQKKDEFALSTQGELEAALRESQVKTVRLKQRLATMGSNMPTAAATADKVRSWIGSDESSPGSEL